MRLLALLGLVGCLLLSGCMPVASFYDAAPYPIVKGAKRLPKLPMYQRLWVLTEMCSQEVGDYSKVEFFYVPGWHIHPRVPDRYLTHDVGGMAYRNDATGRMEIYLPEYYINNEKIVMHEMLHLLGFMGAHSRRIFVVQCQVETEESIKYQVNPVP